MIKPAWLVEVVKEAGLPLAAAQNLPQLPKRPVIDYGAPAHRQPYPGLPPNLGVTGLRHLENDLPPDRGYYMGQPGQWHEGPAAIKGLQRHVEADALAGWPERNWEDFGPYRVGGSYVDWMNAGEAKPAEEDAPRLKPSPSTTQLGIPISSQPQTPRRTRGVAKPGVAPASTGYTKLAPPALAPLKYETVKPQSADRKIIDNTPPKPLPGPGILKGSSWLQEVVKMAQGGANSVVSAATSSAPAAVGPVPASVGSATMPSLGASKPSVAGPLLSSNRSTELSGQDWRDWHNANLTRFKNIKPTPPASFGYGVSKTVPYPAISRAMGLGADKPVPVDADYSPYPAGAPNPYTGTGMGVAR